MSFIKTLNILYIYIDIKKKIEKKIILFKII